MRGQGAGLHGAGGARAAAKARTYVLLAMDWAPVFLPSLLLFALALGLPASFVVDF